MEKKLREKLPDGIFKDVSPIRSRAMSAVKGKNNKTTEVQLKLALVRAGVSGWKLRPRGLPGNPDFYFEKEKLAVFADGCFWHGCPSCGHIPKTRSKFWRAKIDRNIERDKQKTKELISVSISVLRFWEHDIQTDVNQCVNRIKEVLNRKT